MRLLYAAPLAVLISAAAAANTISFGTPFSSGSFTQCSPTIWGVAECDHQAQVDNGTLDNAASVSVQAFAASRQNGDVNTFVQSASTQVSYSIPFTVTRTITFSVDQGSVVASVPIQLISLSTRYSGAIGWVSTSGNWGVQLEATDATLLSNSSPISIEETYDGAVPSQAPPSLNLPFESTHEPFFETSADFAGGSVGEVAAIIDIPIDMRLWEDLLPPFATDYLSGTEVTQSFNGTIEVQFNLIANSINAYSLACAGMQPTQLELQILPDCGSGIGVDASVDILSHSQYPVSVPEPASWLSVL